MNSANIAKYSKTFATIGSLSSRLVLRLPKQNTARWLSAELPKLGPTYVKIGQFIASRRDIFGDDFACEFNGLKNDVPPMTDEEVQYVMDNHMSKSAFKNVDIKPIASASIGQVHRATLRNGQEVIVKIRRPGIEQLIKDDIEFLMSILHVMYMMKMESIQDSIEAVKNFQTVLKREIDFDLEIYNMKRFNKLYNSADIQIPRVYSKLSNKEVIVMEYVPSRTITDFRGDRKKMSKNLMNLLIKQLINNGVVHGDPHTGNMGFTEDGRIVLYDFGNIIEIPDADRQKLKELIFFLLVRNNKGVTKTLKKLRIQVFDEKDMEKYVDLYIEYMKTIDISRLSNSHGPNIKLPLKLTDDVFRLVRVYGIMEGTCKLLDDDFNYFDVLSSFLVDMFGDEEFMRYKISVDAEEFMTSFPGPWASGDSMSMFANAFNLNGFGGKS